MKRAARLPVPPLLFHRRRPLVPQIRAALWVALQSGRLAPGQRLPSTRAFARALRVSRQVIVAVYEELAAAGHLRCRTGDGSYVAPTYRPPLARRTGCRVADPAGHAILVWPGGP